MSHQPEHSNVCFWYVPPSLRGLQPGPDRNARLHQVSAEHTLGTMGRLWYGMIHVTQTMYLKKGSDQGGAKTRPTHRPTYASFPLVPFWVADWISIRSEHFHQKRIGLKLVQNHEIEGPEVGTMTTARLTRYLLCGRLGTSSHSPNTMNPVLLVSQEKQFTSLVFTENTSRLVKIVIAKTWEEIGPTLTNFLCPGCSSDQSQDDGEGLGSDQLPAFRNQRQLLQVCVL